MNGREYDKKLDMVKHYWQIGSYKNMRRACMDALGDNPADPWVLSALTVAYYELGNFSACVRTGTDALAHQTPQGQALVYDTLGNERFCHEDYAKAAEHYKKAAECRPEIAGYLAHYATALAFLGRMDEAQALLERAEAVNPQNYSVLEAKNRIYYQFRRDRKTEEETLSRMLPLSASPFFMNWLLADFHYKYGEFQEAHAYYVKAALARPDDASTREMLRKLEERGYGGIRQVESSASGETASEIDLNHLDSALFRAASC
ncbi:MAG: hypothetical protein LBT26_06370 [Clostridiales Family XIII bacterium]|jgi:tetratricopeptide (TPR) repeat protein|nr:hypothetical protein [Clostridiales Family XIII bacterium]